MSLYALTLLSISMYLPNRDWLGTNSMDVCVRKIASLIGSGQQRLAGRLYEHLVAQPQYQTSAERQALVRRLREAMVKCIIINGIPVVIEAVKSISEVERPEDRDYSCSR